MKGAYLFSASPDLFSRVREILIREGARAASDDVVQVRDSEDRFLTIYGGVDVANDYDLQEPPTAVRGTGLPPELSAASVCWVECRSEAVFARWMALIAKRVPEPSWVLDGDGVVWPASAVDPSEVRL
jgi:hypothetical protein